MIRIASRSSLRKLIGRVGLVTSFTIRVRRFCLSPRLRVRPLTSESPREVEESAKSGPGCRGSLQARHDGRRVECAPREPDSEGMRLQWRTPYTSGEPHVCD